MSRYFYELKERTGSYHETIQIKEIEAFIEGLEDSILLIDDEMFIERPDNSQVDASFAELAAKLEYMVEHSQLKLAKEAKKETKDDDVLNALCTRIMELQEEHDDTIERMVENTLFSRFKDRADKITRVFGYGRESNAFLSYIGLYDEWTMESALYYIIRAKKSFYEMKFRNAIEKTSGEQAERMENAMESTLEQYDVEIKQKGKLLRSYVEDLKSAVAEMVKNFNILQRLEEVKENLIELANA